MKIPPYATIALKLAFAAAILWWLLAKVGGDGVFRALADADPVSALAGFALCWLTVPVAGWRWQRLLGAFGIRVPLGHLICVAQIGQFFMMFLPGPAGDDLTRMVYVSRLTADRRAEACTSVVIDRVIGLSSILLLALGCLPLQWSILDGSAVTRSLSTGMIAAGAFVFLGWMAFLLTPIPIVAGFVRWVASLGSHEFGRRVSGAADSLLARRRILGQVLLAALFTQTLVCLMFWLAGRSVGIALPSTLWISFLPVALAASVVPITVAGIGVREYLLVLFLGTLGHVPEASAMAASLIAFAMMLGVSLVGAFVYLVFRVPKTDAA